MLIAFLIATAVLLHIFYDQSATVVEELAVYATVVCGALKTLREDETFVGGFVRLLSEALTIPEAMPRWTRFPALPLLAALAVYVELLLDEEERAHQQLLRRLQEEAGENEEDLVSSGETRKIPERSESESSEKAECGDRCLNLLRKHEEDSARAVELKQYFDDQTSRCSSEAGPIPETNETSEKVQTGGENRTGFKLQRKLEEGSARATEGLDEQAMVESGEELIQDSRVGDSETKKTEEETGMLSGVSGSPDLIIEDRETSGIPWPPRYYNHTLTKRKNRGVKSS